MRSGRNNGRGSSPETSCSSARQLRGVALLNVQEQHNLLQSALYGFGASAGFGLVLILFSAMRERLADADVPLHFRGAPIALVTAGLMALAFMGFTGLARV